MSPADIDPAELLKAALTRDWVDLSAGTGLSSARLAQLALHLIDEPTVIAQWPTECAQLQRRREAARRARSTEA